MSKLKIDLLKYREKATDKFDKEVVVANKLWYGTIRLIITLSSSFLLLTLAVSTKFFPEIDNFTDLSYFLIGAWVILFLAIIFGIITEIDACIFHGNHGKTTSDLLKAIDYKISQGVEIDIIEIPDRYFVNAPIYWGVATINSFILAVICLCLSFLEELKFDHSIATLLLCVILLLFLNLHLIKKRIT